MTTKSPLEGGGAWAAMADMEKRESCEAVISKGGVGESSKTTDRSCIVV